MYKNTEKKKLFSIMEMYLSNQLTDWEFCDEFYSSFDLELSSLGLNNEEYKAFSVLGDVVGRFSDTEEDIKRYPTFYSTKEELKEKVMETQNKLKKDEPEK